MNQLPALSRAKYHVKLTSSFDPARLNSHGPTAKTPRQSLAALGVNSSIIAIYHIHTHSSYQRPDIAYKTTLTL